MIEKMKNVLKENWKVIILGCIVIVLFPFVLEYILFITPIISKFDNDTWFSFLGSYIGAILTIVVMFITFKKSDAENKELIALQKKQHDIDVQNDKVKRIIQVLLIDGYYFIDADTVCENIHCFFIDLNSICLDTLTFRCVTNKDEPLMDELLKLQKDEVAIYNEFVEKISHVDSRRKSDELIQVFFETGQKLYKVANCKRDIIHMAYEGYLKNVYEHYYE